MAPGGDIPMQVTGWERMEITYTWNKASGGSEVAGNVPVKSRLKGVCASLVPPDGIID